MKTTTMNATVTDNMQELTADEMANVQGGLFEIFHQLWDARYGTIGQSIAAAANNVLGQ
jgi:bacteriocin-like protein